MFSPTLRLRRPLSRSFAHSATSLPPLPDVEAWRKVFPWSFKRRERAVVHNPDTARLLARTFLQSNSQPSGSGKIVIEAFPGEFASCAR